MARQRNLSVPGDEHGAHPGRRRAGYVPVVRGDHDGVPGSGARLPQDVLVGLRGGLEQAGVVDRVDAVEQVPEPGVAHLVLGDLPEVVGQRDHAEPGLPQRADCLGRVRVRRKLPHPPSEFLLVFRAGRASAAPGASAKNSSSAARSSRVSFTSNTHSTARPPWYEAAESDITVQ